MSAPVNDVHPATASRSRAGRSERELSAPRSIATAAVLVALIASSAHAQGQQRELPELSGRRAGESDGRIAGREKGYELGRDQRLARAWLEGFRHGRGAAIDPRDRQDAYDAGHDAGHAQGFEVGQPLGRKAGRDAAAAAYAALRGAPSYVGATPPRLADTPEPPPSRSCRPPQPARIELNRGRSIDVEPQRVDAGEIPFDFDIPRPELPGGSDLRAKARRLGYEQEDDIQGWVRAFREAYRLEFDIAFEAQRDAVSWSAVRDHETDGETVGRDEALRRTQCEELHDGYDRGYRDGHAAGFDAGYHEGWAEANDLHAHHAVVVVETTTLRDANDDSVIEPGERVTLQLQLVNAGLVASDAPAVTWNASRGLAARGVVSSVLERQSRRQDVLDLGAVEPGALMGSSVVVSLEPLRGEPRDVTATVGRPAIIDTVEAFADVRDGELVLVVRPVVRSVASASVDRGLQLQADAARADVGPLAAGEARDVAVVRSATPADALGAPVSGVVELRDGGGAFWMQRPWTSRTAMARAVELVGRLADPEAAAPVIASRLSLEYEQALRDPKLYARAEGTSELSQYARAIGAVPAAARTVLQASASAPLKRRAEERDVPRKVRRAVREALGE